MKRRTKTASTPNENILVDNTKHKRPALAATTATLLQDNKIELSKESLCYWYLGLVLTTVVSVVSRLYGISEAAHVCWDETHFGKMASWYINRTLFFDVHPPLGKMLIAAGGLLSGYNGSFAFEKPGDVYPETVPYAAMRIYCAVLGCAIVPICYCITWTLSHSVNASCMAASLIIFDTGLLTISRYILLDPFMLFFITLCSLCYVQFADPSVRQFSIRWWTWLSLTGVSLACAVSVKFVGLFMVLLVGVSTLKELWNLLGNHQLTMVQILKHFVARVLCLICLPIALYVAIFYVHISILYKSGSGDGLFSSAFQSQLHGNPLYNATMPINVAFGSVVTIKNHRTGGNYLHSHWDLYPGDEGTRHQQVTAYSHKDANNEWILKPAEVDETSDGPRLLYNGDLIRLEHAITRLSLYSHRKAAPLTRRHYQVSCYEQNARAVEHGHTFRIDFVGQDGAHLVKTVSSVFRLTHVGLGCVLHSHDKQLPQWGWEQLEVTCNPDVRHPGSLWNIEQVFDQRLPNASFDAHAMGFMEKFYEFHAVMLRGNKGLKPRDGDILSTPWQWPLNYRGQPFSGSDPRIYLLGNPVIWWSCLCGIIIFVLVSTFIAFMKQCNANLPQSHVHGWTFKNLEAGRWLLLAWLFHYAPFWIMGRILYYHHYFSALIFSIMLTAIVWDFSVALLVEATCSKSMRWCAKYFVVSSTYCVVVYSFYYFSPLSYGMHGPMAPDKTSEMHGRQWLESWDF